MLMEEGAQKALDDMDSCIMQGEVCSIQERINNVQTSDAFLNYLQDIIDFAIDNLTLKDKGPSNGTFSRQ